MKVIRALSIDDAWQQAKLLLSAEGEICSSRAGEVVMHPEPVTTHYANPMLRVLTDPVRDANPFFHLMEALWMIAGRNDVAFVSRFNKRMQSFSDDGLIFHGAYGYRWRHHFDMEDNEDGTDQINKAIQCLRADPKSRRVVIQMWDPRADFWSPEEIAVRGSVPKDLPCNTALYLDARLGKLNMTVTNRSNDIVWGCYGANVVHMSMLQEYIAAQVGLELGWYCQVSNNWHAYRDVWSKQQIDVRSVGYSGVAQPLVDCVDSFDGELTTFLELVEDERLLAAAISNVGFFKNSFLQTVAAPLALAYAAYRSKDFDKARKALAYYAMQNTDWVIAASRWLDRRESGRSSAQGDATPMS
jgi:hypothetical protein